MMTFSEHKLSKTGVSKDVPLEALRGLAALVVVLNHTVLGFLPQYFGVIPSLVKERLQGSVFFVFLNGGAAVSLFFVLSGYILTRRYCATGDIRILMKGAVKRWPRLMGPVFLVTFASYLLFFFHLYRFQEAGLKSGSHWLVQFGDGFVTWSGPYATVKSIHYWNMLQQGTFLTFFRGDALFNSSLWTMHPEMVGSFVAFAIAPVLLTARQSSIWAALWLVLLAVIIANFTWAGLMSFPVGVGMAVLWPRNYTSRLRVAGPALLLSLYLLGYPDSAAGAYRVFGYLSRHGMLYEYPYTTGAAILIGVIESYPPIRQVFSGRISIFLGDLSFPIYLVHVPIICSAGSFVYLRSGAIPAIICVFTLSALASLPLIRFNRWWISRVNAGTEKLLQPRQLPEKPASTITDTHACTETAGEIAKMPY